MATWNGLASYDGTTWTTYNSSNSSLPDNVVGEVFVMSDGRLLVNTFGAGSSFGIFDNGNWTYLSNLVAHDLIEGLGGNVWIGTDGQGLARLLNGTLTYYNSSNTSLSQSDITDLTYGTNGQLWVIAGGNQLLEFSGGDFSAVPGAPTNFLGPVNRGLDGHVWLGESGYLWEADGTN